MREIKSLAILGPGLLGGSLGLATKDSLEVRFWGRNPEKIAPLSDAGFHTVSADLATVIKGADLIILAIPVPYMKDLVQQLVEVGLTKEQLISDVGSVKTSVTEELQPLLGAQGYKFIGSHPMAGSESQGFESARADLFQGAPCILTPDEYSEASDLATLEHFWQSLGTHTHILSPEDHDETVSRVSHIPHILAAVCANVALNNPENAQYAGGGLRDTSRVASGDPRLWSGILSENSEIILSQIDEAINRLTEYRDALSKNDGAPLEDLLAEDKVCRDHYSA